MKHYHLALLIVSLGLTSSVLALDNLEEALNQCYSSQIAQSDESRTVRDIQLWCQQHLEEQFQLETKIQTPFQKRLLRERDTRDNPNVITPHNRNYLLPIAYTSNPNDEPFIGSSYEGALDKLETKFQMSFKAPIAASILQKEDTLFFGFTIQSYWQMYNSDLSSPFRETNYQPEIFYGFLTNTKLGQWTNRVNIIGIEHQSNGRAQPLSRSWNRIYANFIWENDRWIIGFKPWYHLPEKAKTEPNQADGDDNPDIDKYMGHFEFQTAYKWDDQTFGLMFRNNLRADNRGALQLDWTFPMGRRFKGYAQYFNGYGESLIDYDQSIQRFGLGILLTDLF